MQNFFSLNNILFLLLLIFTATESKAQKPVVCATPTPTGAPRLVPSNYERPTDITGMRMIKLYFFVTKGEYTVAQPAQTEEEILAHFEIVRQQFTPHGICFILAGISEIVSDDLNVIDAEDPDDFALVASYAATRPDCLSVFFHGVIAGDLIGTAWNIPNTFVSLEGNYAWSGYPVLGSHEIGHALGLLHTFEDHYGVELVARSGACSNCSTTGDLICDTQADLNFTSNTFNNNCVYTGSRKDSCNNPYVMEPANTMSYNALSACTYGFTAGQALRMHYTLNSTPALLSRVLNSSSFTITNNLNYSSGNYIFPYKINLTVNSPSYVVTGAAKMQITSAEIIIKPGASFSPTTGISVLRANVLCQ